MQNKITPEVSYYIITFKYLYQYQIISLDKAWYKVRRLANFVKIDRDSWHSLATLAILGGCPEGIVSKTPIVDSSWLIMCDPATSQIGDK
jgi:hypothetical protein